MSAEDGWAQDSHTDMFSALLATDDIPAAETGGILILFRLLEVIEH